MARTPRFQCGNTGSIPVGATRSKKWQKGRFFVTMIIILFNTENMETFEPTRPIRETKDLVISTDSVEGRKFFVKQAKTEEGIIANTRELNNQKFLTTVTDGKDAGFEFLEPTFDGKNLSYIDINESADWLAHDNSPGTQMVPLSEYSEEMVKFFKFCLQIPYDKIPEEIKIDSQKRLANVMVNLEKDSKTLMESGIITEADAQKMKKCLENGFDQQAFQHHDVVPWHMARKRSDKNLVLVDSGWSGWSLKYYDIAYYVLQMVGYAQRPDDALNFLDIVKEEFKDDLKFKEILSSPLSYRGVRLAAELHRQGKVKNAQEVISLALSEI